MARAKLALRRSQLPLWGRFLQRTRPELLFLVVSYGNEIPIEVCRALRIPTVELQHGIVSRNNLGYHFPDPSCRKQLFPEWFFAFGDFWRDAADFPIAGERVVSVGYRYLELRRDRTAEVARAPRALFLSQRSIGVELSKTAVHLAKHSAMRGEVVYKLHPGERATWRHDYPWLLDAPVRVVDDEVHLYELFASSTLQVGVYSTALFEGLAFGLTTRVAQLPGWEAMRPLVESCAAADWMSDVEQLATDVVAPPPPAEDLSAIFRPGADENLRRAVVEIVSSS